MMNSFIPTSCMRRSGRPAISALWHIIHLAVTEPIFGPWILTDWETIGRLSRHQALDRPDCACWQDLFICGRNAKGPDHWQERNFHHRDRWHLRCSDENGFVQFCRTVPAISLRLPRRDGCNLPHCGWDRRAEPGARPRRVLATHLQAVQTHAQILQGGHA